MNRRDIMKGLAIMAAARVGANQVGGAQVVSACSNGVACMPVSKSLLVWLEGPFAVVLNRDTVTNIITGVTAFSPVDTDHLTNITNGPSGGYPFQYHYTLNGPGLAGNLSSACVSSDFNDFCGQSLGMVGSPDNSFVRVTLPCPKNIYTTKLRKGTLGAGSGVRNVCIPQDHVLEYEIVSEQPTTLVQDVTGLMVPALLNLFHIEVGLPLQIPSVDPQGIRAQEFHNKSILGFFPNLQADPNQQLTSISNTSTCPSHIPEAIASRLRAASTLECKSGGIIGGNP